MKTCHVIANWKMHKTSAVAVEFVQKLKKSFDQMAVSSEQTVALAVPFTMIHSCHEAASGAFQVGAQNMHDATEGAFTGEISSLMLVDAKADFVLLGHSERRHIFGENEAFVASKLKKALNSTSLQVVFCVGETLQEREANSLVEVLTRQLDVLKDLSLNDQKRVMIAYEPFWAVGTGKVASLKDIEKAHQAIGDLLKAAGFKEENIKILYGGSVTAENVRSIVAIDLVSGVLVGGASLEVESFSDLLKAAFTVEV
jgi:triosephosphate isomerase